MADNQPTVSDAQRRAQHAQRLIEDPLMVEAFETLESTYVEAWLSTEYGSDEARERAYHIVHAGRIVRGQLKEIIINGKVEASRVKQTLTPSGKK